MAVHSHANHSSYKITTSVRLRTAAPSSSMLLVFACSESSYLSESKRDRHISPLSSDFNGFLSQVSNLSFLTSTSTSVKQTPQHKNLLRQEVLSGFQGNTPKTQPYSTFTKCKLQHFRFDFPPNDAHITVEFAWSADQQPLLGAVVSLHSPTTMKGNWAKRKGTATAGVCAPSSIRIIRN